MEHYTDTALKYHAAGLHTVPFRRSLDGKIDFPSWQKYQHEQTEDDVRTLFSEPSDGLALICTGGIEAIDIDVKYDLTGTLAYDFLTYLRRFPEVDDIAGLWVFQSTKSGGWHIIYRTDAGEGNQKLATRPTSPQERAENPMEKQKTLIETRGSGGLLFIAPSPGYEIRQGDLTGIQPIPRQTRDLIIQAARHFTQPDPERLKIQKPAAMPGQGMRPGDAFDEGTDLEQLLENYGWTSLRSNGDYTYMNRPGAKHRHGIDGTLIRRAGLPDLFYPWSSSTEFQRSEVCYTAFGVYATYEHRGDFQAAAGDLRKQGFGSTAPTAPIAPPTERPAPSPIILPDLAGRVIATRFDYREPINEESAVLTVEVGGKKYKVAGEGMLGTIVGEQKSGKSLLTQCLTATALAGGSPRLGFSMDLPGSFEYYDTEQSSFFYKLSQRRIHQMAGVFDNTSRYSAYHLRGFMRRERVAAIDYMLKGRKLSLLVIDGVVDLCDDFMDARASEATIEKLLQWSSDTGALLIVVLHLTKGQGFMRGHLGTALQNKCDFAVEVQKDRDMGEFKVVSRESRFAPFPPFSFTRDDQGFPAIDEISNSFPARRKATIEEETPF